MWPEGILRTGHEPYLSQKGAGAASITITADDGTSTGHHAGLMARVGYEAEPSYACRSCSLGVEAMDRGSGMVQVPQGMYNEEFECAWHWPLSVWNIAMRWESFALDEALDTVQVFLATSYPQEPLSQNSALSKLGLSRCFLRHLRHLYMLNTGAYTSLTHICSLPFPPPLSHFAPFQSLSISLLPFLFLSITL
jgi:hypothetical protein